MADKFSLKQVLRNVETLKRTLPVKLGNVTQRFFVDSFKKQGWDGPTGNTPGGLASSGIFQPWKERKKKEARARNILVKSGRLRRAVADSVRRNTWPTVMLMVDIPYAEIHNDGGTIRMPAREQVQSLKRSKGVLKLARTRTEKQREKVVAQRKVKIPAYNINIPQRRYMGDSPTLRKLQIKLIETEIDKVFNIKS